MPTGGDVCGETPPRLDPTLHTLHTLVHDRPGLLGRGQTEDGARYQQQAEEDACEGCLHPVHTHAVRGQQGPAQGRPHKGAQALRHAAATHGGGGGWGGETRKRAMSTKATSPLMCR